MDFLFNVTFFGGTRLMEAHLHTVLLNQTHQSTSDIISDKKSKLEVEENYQRKQSLKCTYYTLQGHISSNKN